MCEVAAAARALRGLQLTATIPAPSPRRRQMSFPILPFLTYSLVFPGRRGGDGAGRVARLPYARTGHPLAVRTGVRHGHGRAAAVVAGAPHAGGGPRSGRLGGLRGHRLGGQDSQGRCM